MIQQHKCLEKILETLDKDKYKVPEDWPYQEARRLFKEPEVQKGSEVEVTITHLCKKKYDVTDWIDFTIYLVQME